MRPFGGRILAAALALTPLMLSQVAEARPLRVMSLDQCADQYVLALAPDAELLLSPRADDPDSWARSLARGRPSGRPTLEAAVGFQPDVVVRYWAGEPRLLSAIERRGVAVAMIDDATDMAGVRANIRRVAVALGAPRRGEALIGQMDRRLAQARPPRKNTPAPKAMYLTAGGSTAGRGTLIDAIFAEAGYTNFVTGGGFQMLSVERLVLAPPVRLVLAFFDQAQADWRGAGRHPAVRRLARDRTAARLPAETLTCPAWFVADAALMLSRGVQ